MTTSTLELMKAVLGRRGDEPPATASLHPSAAASEGTEAPDRPERRRATMVKGANATVPKRYPPMNLYSLPTGITRSVRFVSLFRRELHDPDTFHRFRAADTMRQVLEFRPLAGASAVDIGGGRGYIADALCDQRASCLVVEYLPERLEDGRAVPATAVRGDGQALPVADQSTDFAHSADLLPRVQDPQRLLHEMARVLKPGSGVGYVSFTNWYSPWGGHEISPWHYLGAPLATRRYRRKHGRQPANQLGVNLHRLHIVDVLHWFARQPELEVYWAGPRYWPEWARPIVRVPGVREVATGNLAVLFGRKEQPSQTARPEDQLSTLPLLHAAPCGRGRPR